MFTVEIKECSKELTARERIRIKDISNAIKLDEACNDDKVVITPVDYAILAIHNDTSDNPDYTNYIIIDANGTKYVTGSPSFWNTFTGIWEEMSGESETYSIECYKLDSKNYKGKKFITCSII